MPSILAGPDRSHGFSVVEPLPAGVDTGQDFALRMRSQYPIYMSSRAVLSMHSVQPEGHP